MYLEQTGQEIRKVELLQSGTCTDKANYWGSEWEDAGLHSDSCRWSDRTNPWRFKGKVQFVEIFELMNLVGKSREREISSELCLGKFTYTDT